LAASGSDAHPAVAIQTAAGWIGSAGSARPGKVVRNHRHCRDCLAQMIMYQSITARIDPVNARLIDQFV
jgi:hypothetical protein